MNTRTNIVLDDELVEKAMARAGVTTKKAAVEAALRAYVRKPDYSGLLALVGTGVIADDYDPKAAYGFAPTRMDHYVADSALDRRPIIPKVQPSPAKARRTPRVAQKMGGKRPASSVA